jgi:hypothetical protein
MQIFLSTALYQTFLPRIQSLYLRSTQLLSVAFAHRLDFQGACSRSRGWSFIQLCVVAVASPEAVIVLLMVGV